VVKDGINFHLGKSFYRFDFYKVERAKTGANFIALYLKGSTVVRLFLFEEPAHQDSDIRKSIEEYFNAAG
jgi:hypothetical protein